MRSRLARPDWILAAAAIITLFLLSLMIDLVPRFHLGDSTIFILADPHGYIPDNRSWTYGFSVHGLLRATRWLVSVPVVQIFLLWAAFALFAISAAKAARLRLPIALLIVLVGCFEPLGFYWSRAIMSDSAAQAMFVLLCAGLLFPVGLLLRFVLVLILGFALVSLRVVYFPALVGAAGIALVWQCRFASRSRISAYQIISDRAVLAWGIALVAVILANILYAGVNMHMTRGRVLTSNIGDMAFLAGALSPIVSDHLDRTPLTAKERSELIPLTYQNRVKHTFDPHGLVPLIRRHFSSMDNARPVLRQLIVDSVRKHPLAFAELVLRQWADYLNPVLVVHVQRTGALSGAAATFRNDPRVVLPDHLIRLLRSWNVKPLPAPNSPSQPSPALWYLEACGGVWSVILAWYATLSIFLVFALPANNRSAFLIFINSFAFLYLATIALGANQLVTRYLLPLNLPFLYTFAVLARARSAGRDAGGEKEVSATADSPAFG